MLLRLSFTALLTGVGLAASGASAAAAPSVDVNTLVLPLPQVRPAMPPARASCVESALTRA